LLPPAAAVERVSSLSDELTARVMVPAEEEAAGCSRRRHRGGGEGKAGAAARAMERSEGIMGRRALPARPGGGGGSIGLTELDRSFLVWVPRFRGWR
jgi:hypothetical protein